MRVGLTEEVLKAGFAGHFGRNAAPLPGGRCQADNEETSEKSEVSC